MEKIDLILKISEKITSLNEKKKMIEVFSLKNSIDISSETVYIVLSAQISVLKELLNEVKDESVPQSRSIFR